MDILKYCKREEADPQYMWDLSALYKTEEEFEKAVKTIDLMADGSRIFPVLKPISVRVLYIPSITSLGV